MLGIGDIILYQRKNVIAEWEINKFSPSGKYVAIENDDYEERWIPVRDVLEVIESESGDELPPTTEIDVEAMIEASKQPISRARTTTKDFGFKHEV